MEKLKAICLVTLLFVPPLLASAQEVAVNLPGAPSPQPAASGEIVSLRIEEGAPAAATLSGKDARRQIVVTGVTPSGGLVDLTGKVRYSSNPEGIVTLDSTGVAHPAAEGQTTVVASLGALQATTPLKVEHLVNETPINFPNQVVPIFTKLSCNSGGCHGKSGGQNGFRLSLLGFEPTEDYEHLVKEARGRRLFPAAPDLSLLLTKPVNTVPHGGGQRMEVDSHDYRVLRRWIAQGMPYGSPNDPSVDRIQIMPEKRLLPREGSQQIAVLAHYTDGSVEDITHVAQYDSNNAEMAEVNAGGLVKAHAQSGDFAIMARYRGHVATFRATIPLGQQIAQLPPARNFIDELVFAKLKLLGMPPSAVCDDSVFLRRVTLDIAGRIPTPEETTAFLADPGSDKRDRLIERLLASDDYADYFANKWNAILRNRPRAANHARSASAFHDWIRDSLNENRPYDQFVREIVAASGDVAENPPVAWYREVQTVEQQVEDCAQLFLGMRVQCARCHHHPFEKWSQNDYYKLAGFFSKVGRKPGAIAEEQRIHHVRGEAVGVHPKTGQKLKPAGLDAEAVPLAPEDDPREALADWMSSPDNPFFAPALVNRYWKHFFARGLVEPEDDMRVTNPPSNPELLNALAKHFIEHKFDMKDLIRTMCQSTTYQLGSEPNEHNLADKQNYSRYYPKRMSAEVLLDSFDNVTKSPTAYAGLPAGTRAVQLADPNAASYFLTVFGRPQGATACECERSPEANLAQSLHLLNSTEMQAKLAAKDARPAVLAADSATPPETKINDLYLRAYSRPPKPEELSVAVAHVAKNEKKQQAYEDIVWALINTKEFLFNH